MPDKGNVYLCTWEKAEDGTLVGWEVKHRKRRFEGDTPDELTQVMAEAIWDLHDDQEAALEFDPPLPCEGQERRWFKDGFVTLSWNGGFRAERTHATAFTRGQCPNCSNGIGVRSTVPLLIDSIDGATDGATPWIDSPGTFLIVTEAFLVLLNGQERALFDTRPVQFEHKRRLRFFEVLPKRYVPTALRRDAQLGGWRCEECGFRQIGHSGGLEYGIDCISRKDLPRASNAFFVGSPHWYDLCVTHQRYLELRESKGTRKLGGNPLAVFEEHECDRDPWLASLKQIRAFHRRYGERTEYARPGPIEGPLVPAKRRMKKKRAGISEDATGRR